MRRQLTYVHILPAYGMVLAVYLIAISWSQPVLDLFGFRQSQTAISAFWLARGAPFWSYITPIAGYPWSIPFELPVYQFLVGKLAPGASVTAIEHTGRLLSLGFFLGACSLVYRIVILWARDRMTAVLCVGTLLASPLMAFWSRSVMIESTALFLGIAFVWCFAEFVRSSRRYWMVLAVIASSAGALVKITTFFGFAFFVAVVLTVHFVRSGGAEQRKRTLILAMLAAAGVLLSLLVLKIWLLHADALKAQALWAGSLRSDHLGGWNYGTWAQRLNPGFWINVVLGRSVRDGLGTSWLLPVALAVVLARGSTRIAGIVLFASYLMPFTVFTNLYQVHDYYPYANMVFVTTLLALAIRNASDVPGFGHGLAIALVVLTCVLSWRHVSQQYVPSIVQDMQSTREMRIASALRHNTPTDSVLIVLGMDWNAAMPYYAQRRAVMMPDWVGVDRLKELESSNQALGGGDVGAIVVCPSGASVDAERLVASEAVVRRYSKGLHAREVSGCIVFVADEELKS